MFRNLILAGVAAVGLLSTSAVDAREPAYSTHHRATVHGPAYASHYRYAASHRGVWQERRFHNSREAEFYRARMIRRGYEVNILPHGFFFDVRFRLPC